MGVGFHLLFEVTNQAFNKPMTHIKNEITTADPHLIPLDTTKTSLCGNALNINMMLEKSQPVKPLIRIIDQISRHIKILFP